MEDMGIIQGSVIHAKPLIIGKDTVYIHTDIKPVEGKEGLYEYHEIQYTKDEYIELMANRVQEQEQLNTEYDTMIVDLMYKVALLEMGDGDAI